MYYRVKYIEKEKVGSGNNRQWPHKSISYALSLFTDSRVQPSSKTIPVIIRGWSIKSNQQELRGDTSLCVALITTTLRLVTFSLSFSLSYRDFLITFLFSQEDFFSFILFLCSFSMVKKRKRKKKQQHWTSRVNSNEKKSENWPKKWKTQWHSKNDV